MGSQPIVSHKSTRDKGVASPLGHAFPKNKYLGAVFLLESWRERKEL